MYILDRHTEKSIENRFYWNISYFYNDLFFIFSNFLKICSNKKKGILKDLSF